MNTYTKEQREAWDKITGPGLYTVEGDAAYLYVCHRIKWMVLDRADPKTIILIGTADERERFLKVMIEEGVLEVGEIEPWFFFYQDYIPDGDDDYVPRSLWSENDTEDFCNFIRHSRAKAYWPVGAVVLLGEQDQLKYVDKLLKIPVWHGSTKEKDIELPVFNVSSVECDYSDFSKANNSTPSGLKQTLVLRRADEVEEESVGWLVPEFIPLHAPTVFSGQMDTLKSTLAIDVAAALSSWRPWFMGDQTDEHGMVIHHQPCITLFAGSEDKFESTVVPRYKAAGGNPDCLYNVELQVTCEKQTNDGAQVWETPLNLDEHIGLLKEQIQYLNNTREWKVGLLICDPLITLFGNKNYCSPQDANDLMIKVKQLCEEQCITVLSIAHYNKTQGLVAKDKTSGAKRIVEAHRQAWGFDRAEGDSETTIISPIKKNLLAKAKSYKITTIDRDGVGIIKFLGFTDVTADEQIEAREDKGRGKRKELNKVLLDVLKDGPMSPGQVCNQLQDMGCSVRTIQRAAEQLEDEGKLIKSGTNRKNMLWQLATEAEQPAFDEVR